VIQGSAMVSLLSSNSPSQRAAAAC